MLLTEDVITKRYTNEVKYYADLLEESEKALKILKTSPKVDIQPTKEGIDLVIPGQCVCKLGKVAIGKYGVTYACESIFAPFEDKLSELVVYVDVDEPISRWKNYWLESYYVEFKDLLIQGLSNT